ncbi:hypothetical protein JAAARDRAFT_200477 [Jaapia argillacea MUCL 33604]|uniref:Uncharacterized protein n=1 Tax=Jaapia argillacea MUCL 33604 TaxID=933084 RepID=A0A067P7M9_9AGAM|nr:hypothetical protein JAAARDRAFT_200477 [Jaapia argillacea MUCL 33604]
MVAVLRKEWKKLLTKKVTVIVDMNDIKSCCQFQDGDDDANHDDEAGDDNTDFFGNRNIFQMTSLLERSSSNGEFEYSPSSGEPPIKITPAKCCDWCEAIIAGRCTIFHPPNTDAFNPEKHHATLHPDRQFTPATPATPTLTSNLGALASIIITIFGAALGDGFKTLPHCHMLAHVDAISTPPPIPHLCSYGPDVLQMFDEKQFENLGFTPGDSICLKNRAMKWWHGPEAKRKCADLVAGASESDVEHPKAKEFRYEVEFLDGGQHIYYGPGMCPGESKIPGQTTRYFCEVQNCLVPVLAGMVAPPATSEEWQMMEDDGITWGDWNVVG